VQPGQSGIFSLRVSPRLNIGLQDFWIPGPTSITEVGAIAPDELGQGKGNTRKKPLSLQACNKT